MSSFIGVITKAIYKSSEEDKKEEEVKKTLEQHDSIVTHYKNMIREQVRTDIQSLLYLKFRYFSEASLVTPMVKNPPGTQETQVQSLGWEEPLENGMATHSSILAWGSNGHKNLVGYTSWSCKELDMTKHSYFSALGKNFSWHF